MTPTGLPAQAEALQQRRRLSGLRRLVRRLRGTCVRSRIPIRPGGVRSFRRPDLGPGILCGVRLLVLCNGAERIVLDDLGCRRVWRSVGLRER